jgi:hypothetical protein
MSSIVISAVWFAKGGIVSMIDWEDEPLVGDDFVLERTDRSSSIEEE